MVIHYWKIRQKGWRKAIALNFVGAVTTFVVLLVISVSKFMLGAWMVILLIPLFVLLFRKINRHYLDVGKQLVLSSDVQPLKA
jgi:Na+-transporting NADH:ubiquinone oxidoreductase subunit NqrB